jgi:O-antigen/teichoic acid export membrane protein
LEWVIASTKFASEAFGQGDKQKEAQVVWTAAAIALIASLIVAIPICFFRSDSRRLKCSGALANTGDHRASDRRTAIVLGVLGSVVKLADALPAANGSEHGYQAVPKILLALITPFILYFGWGIVGAVAWALIVGIGTLVVVFYFSVGLLPDLSRPRGNRSLLSPLLKFGAGILAGSIAAILLMNFEKLALSRMISVTSLAYYSVAYTLANIAMLFSTAMTQSLVPAFSQMLTPDKRPELDSLFGSTIRITIVWLLPMIALLFVLARPFFELWAGEDFGRESTLPFYLLLIGVSFNMLAFIQHSLITAMGRTGLLCNTLLD